MLFAATESPLPTEPASDIQTVIDGAGPIAGLFVLLLAIALVILIVSMTRQFKKINPDLPAGKADLHREQDAEYTEEAVEKGEAEST